MKTYVKFLLTIILLFFKVYNYAQEVKVSGQVIEVHTGIPIDEAMVSIGNFQTSTDTMGNFNLTVAKGLYVLTVNAIGYDVYSTDLKVEDKDIILDPISLRDARLGADVGISDESVVSLASLEGDKVEQNISGILANSQDNILSMASFNLGFIRFQFRGYSSQYYDVYINGIPMNQAETGRPVWSEWGGLNDAMRNQESYNGLSVAHFGIGGISGLTNINTRPSMMRKQYKISYAASNRSYNNRVKITYGSGLMKNNWAFAVNASKRWAEEGYVEGTWYDAWSLFFAAEKRFNREHSILISAFNSPYRRALQAPATQEAYDLTGTNFYNPNWGWQEGKKRNARIRKMHKPTFIVNHYWTPSGNFRMNNAISYSYLDFGTTALNWYDAPNPRPNFFRYLPSHQTNPYIQGLVADAWQNDQSVSQINWDKLYQVNYLQNLEGKQAKYMIENRKRTSHTINFAPNYNWNINKNFLLSGGIKAQYYKSENYKVIDDLLGGEFWIDIDQFAERDFPGNAAVLINDLLNPDVKLIEGNKFGYHYNLSRNRGKFWNVLRLTKEKYEAFAAYSILFTRYQREGKMKNGRYPDNSLGKSEALNFITHTAKAGFTYKLTGRDFLNVNLAFMTLPPQLSDVFVVPTIANKYIANIDREQILSGDISYSHTGKNISGRISLYQTFFENQTTAINFYHDDLRTFVNYTQTGMDKIHQGIEAGLSIELLHGLSWSIFTNIGNHIYTSRPEATISHTNGARPDTSKTIYSKYFFDFESPQFVATSGIRYNSNNFWFVNLNVNYFDKYYMSYNPERRTEQAIANLGPDDPLIDMITEQYRFDSGFTVDISFNKSWRVKNNFIALNIGINNVLNNQQIRSGGFEQMRYDFENKNLNKFPPKYFYAQGRNYFAMISYRF